MTPDWINKLELAKLLADIDDDLRTQQRGLRWWQSWRHGYLYGGRSMVAAIIEGLELQDAANLAHSPFGALLVQRERTMGADR